MLNEIGMVWVIRNNKDSVKYNDDKDNNQVAMYLDDKNVSI